MIEYIDSCLTLEILKQDSGLLPKPKPNWNTFIPQKGMIAHVDQDDSDYVFDGLDWVIYVPEKKHKRKEELPQEDTQQEGE